MTEARPVRGVLLILSDHHRWDAMGHTGAPYHTESGCAGTAWDECFGVLLDVAAVRSTTHSAHNRPLLYEHGLFFEPASRES